MTSVLPSKATRNLAPGPRGPRRGLALVVLALLLRPGGAAARQVLVLNSYHLGYAWSDAEVAGIRAALTGDPMPVVEYLDAKRHPKNEHWEQLRSLYAVKYPAGSLALVMAVDDPALKFVLRYRNALFAGVPVVFCGINDHTPGAISSLPAITGVYQNDDVVGTLELVRRLQPQVKAIRVVHDYTVSGIGARHELDAVLPRFGSSFEVSYAPDQPLSDLLTELSRLPSNTVVLLLVYANDRDGRVYELAESTRRICRSAPVPVYTINAMRLGSGVIGGSLLAGDQHGARAARLAQRVLAGRDPEDIPEEDNAGARPMFDDAVLRRFGLRRESLPADSFIINQPVPQGLLHGERRVLVGVVTVLALLWGVTHALGVRQRRQWRTRCREAEQRFAALFRGGPSMVALTRYDDGLLLDLNEAFERHLCCPRDEVLGRSVLELGLYADAQDRERLLSWVREQGSCAGVELDLKARDGRHVSVLVSSALVELSGEQCLLNVLVDVTERRRLESDLRRGEARHQAMSERLAAVAAIGGELLLCRDEASLYKMVVELARERLGVVRCSVHVRDGDWRRGTFGTDRDGQTVDESGLVDVLDDSWEALFRARGLGDRLWEVVEEPLTETHDGQVVDLGTGWIVRTPIASAQGVVGVFCNDAGGTAAPVDADLQAVVATLCALLGQVVQRTRDEARTAATAASERQLQKRLRALAELSNDLARVGDFHELCRQAVELGRQRLGFDRLGLWFRVDDQPLAEGSFGTDERGQTRDERGVRVRATPDSALGRVWERQGMAMLERDCPIRDQYGRIIGQGTVIFAGLWDGERVIGSLNCDNLLSNRPLGEQDAELLNLYAAVIGHLCTRQRQAEARAELEAQLRQATKMEAVGQLAGGVAHDFNNLLTTMSCFSEFLLEGLPVGSPLRGDVEQIKQAASRAADLTRQLLAFSRKQMIQPRPLDLNEQVRGLEKLLRRLIGEDVQLVVELATDLGQVMADPGQLDQVLMNLVVNAKQAMPDGGRVTISTAEVTLDVAYARSHLEVRPGRYLRLSVSDSGVGMSEETRTRIFEPFFTTKGPGEGTGLGLSTVYGIVKQNEGHIECRSEPGHGTRFDVYLPRIEPADEAEATAVVDQALTGRETILLVEDEEAVRRLASRVLASYGYHVVEAANAAEAVRAAEKTDRPIDLLLTDVIMPGMNGRDLARHLHAEQPHLRVLYMTGYADSALASHGVLQTQAPVIQKPFSPRALAEQVRELLDGPPASES